MAITFFFPGQGSQSVGMGKELSDTFEDARLVFEEIDDALGEKLSKIIWEGPDDQLTMTENTQPALMAVSIAVMRVLVSQGLDLKSSHYFAGHSLGEYSALCAAGTLTLSDTARLLRLRGRSMQEAVPVGEGAMAALLGLSFEQAAEIAQNAAEGDVCQAANDNADGQVVISGHTKAVERACSLAKEAGAKRAVNLPVSAPFHCALMQPAAERMQTALAETKMQTPIAPIICNVTAMPETDPTKLCQNLITQVTGTVRWRETMGWLNANGANHFVEAGAGKVLTGMIKRANRDAKTQSINTPQDIDAFFEQQ